MLLNKYDKSNEKSVLASVTSSVSSSSGTDTRGQKLDRTLWGNHDNGDSIDETIHVNGSVYAHKFDASDDEGDEDEDKTSSEDENQYEEEEDDEGGNLYGYKLRGYEEVHGNELHVNYPNKDGAKTNVLDLLKMLVPIGSIIMHNGSITKEELLKYGWAICDGTNGTPDLKDKFIKGVTSTSEVGGTGGQSSVTLSTDNMPSHNHTATTTINVEVTNNEQTTPTNVADKYIPALDTIQEEYYDTGGSSNAIMYTGNKKGDYGLVGIKVSDLVSYAGTASGGGSATTTIGNTGGGQAFNVEPPYYALIYIQRIS